MNIFEFMYETFKFNKKEIKLFEAFAGVGSQAMALQDLSEEYNFKLNTIGISEIDKYAIKSYNAIHGNTKNYGSICDIKEIPQVDIFTYSFPCQDISLAGNQKGFTKGSGTRSGLLWEVERLLDNQFKIGKLPQVLLMENVKALASSKFVNDFNKWQLKLQELGYSNYWEILNAKDYGIPQNRERVFMVSILGEWNYTFPKPFELKLRLKDMLEDEVDEKFYLSDKMINFFKENTKKQQAAGNGFKFDPQYGTKTAKAITTNAGSRMDDNFILIPEATEKGYAEASEGDGVYINRPHQKRGVVQKDMIQTLKTGQDVGVVVKEYEGYITWKNKQGQFNTQCNRASKGNYSLTIASNNTPLLLDNLKIRKLTPLECWRLMGFSDKDFYAAQKVNSNTQLYKQAGNSIVKDVLYHIFKQLI